MKQEDKELLLKDLSARLPYGVKASYYGAEEECETWDEVEGVESSGHVEIGQYFLPIERIKPYLYPLSNLTEEQRNDISKLLINTQDEFPPYGKINIGGCGNLFISTVKQANALIKYCITHHFDYIGLIPLGLAIDATGLNIYD